MAEASTTQLQGWINRMSAGDWSARNELINHAGERLRRLTRKMLQDFPRVKRWADSDDVFQGALMRLWRTLEEVQPPDVRALGRLAALAIRRELLDLARHFYGPHGLGANLERRQHPADSSLPTDFQAGSTFDPDRLALWTEFHDQVEKLPEAEREVFDLLWYQGLTQKEAANLLGVSVPTLKRRWQSARLEIHRRLQGQMP